jgi:hypothetical protein
MIGSTVQLLLQLAFLVTSVASLTATGVLLSRKTGHGEGAVPAAMAMALTAFWAVAAVAVGLMATATMALLSLTYLAWLVTLYRLFARDARDKSVGPIRPVVMALALVELLQLALLTAYHQYAGLAAAGLILRHFAVIFRLLFCTGALAGGGSGRPVALRSQSRDLRLSRRRNARATA